jgi:cell wall-associated NlpC family hydrolase
MPLTPEQRKQIIQECKEWVEAKTPYIAQGQLKGIGCDCATFVLCVYRSLGLIPSDFDPGTYSIQAHLHKETVTTQYIDTVREYAQEITEDEAQPGDLVLFRVAYAFAHSGIITEGSTIVHSMNRHGVIYSDYKQDSFLKGRRRLFFTLK